MQWKQRVQKLHRFDIETTQENPRVELIDVSSILKVESTSKFSRRIDVIISTRIRLSKPMQFRRTFHVEFRRQIDDKSMKMCPLDNQRKRNKIILIIPTKQSFIYSYNVCAIFQRLFENNAISFFQPPQSSEAATRGVI